MENIIIRKAISNNDSNQLKQLLNKVFDPEKVGNLGEIFFHYLPGMKNDYWFLAEDTATEQLVSSFTLIPWEWEYEGIKLKIAEMGLVGTDENYRGKGLMKLLNREFDKTLEAESFDLAVIQGIPGFYHKFGYHYSLAMENHINLPLNYITQDCNNDLYEFRLANENDIPYLMKEEEKYRDRYSISVFRDIDIWKYVFNQGQETEYGSEIWIMESKTGRLQKFYFRIQLQGFGSGLIINETSEEMDNTSFEIMFSFCKKLALERSKPYIRINMHNQSGTGKYAIGLGAAESLTYAWQIKMINKAGLLSKLIPLMEKRIEYSNMKGFSGTLRFDFYQETIDIQFQNGLIGKIIKDNKDFCPNIFCISPDLFAALVFGHRSWKELQYVRPDIFPEPLYTNPVDGADNKSGQLIEILFPKTISWIYLRY